MFLNCAGNFELVGARITTPSLLVLFVCDIENSDVIRISVLNVMCRENHPRLKLGFNHPLGWSFAYPPYLHRQHASKAHPEPKIIGALLRNSANSASRVKIHLKANGRKS